LGRSFTAVENGGIIFPCRLAVNDLYAAGLAHEAASREMLEHYSHVRQQAKRRAVKSLDNVTITSQLGKWEAAARKKEEAKERRNNGKRMVGTGGFELPTPRTPSGSEGSESK
jgi:hypothetical protein